MEKKTIITFLVALILIAVWLFFIGQSGQSGIAGDINLLDEGQFAAWVHHMLRGNTIYRDIYVQYGPLMVFPIYFLMKIFGESIFYVRLWNIITVLMGFSVVIITLRALKINTLLSAFCLASLLIIPGINIRQWGGVLFLYLAFESYRRKTFVFPFLAGILISMIAFFSIEVAVFSLFSYSFYIIARFIKTNDLLYELRILAILILGAALSTLTIVIIGLYGNWIQYYFLTAKEFSNSIAGINLPNGQGLPNVLTGASFSTPLDLLKFLFSKSMLFYWSLLILVVYISILTIRLTLKIREKSDVFAALIAVFCLFIYFSIVGRSGHYFTVVPFLIILSVYFISISKRAKKKGERNFKIFTSVLLILFSVYTLRHVAIFRYSFIPNFSTIQSSKNDLILPIHISIGQYNDIARLNNFFDIYSKPNQSIYILNNEPAFYLLLNKGNATRYDLPLLAGSIEKRHEIVNQLLKNRPMFILENTKTWDVDGISSQKRLPEVYEYVHNNYSLFKRVGQYIVYRYNGV